MALTKGKIEFKGNFGDYFLKSVALFFLSVCTGGLLLPYWIYWQFKFLLITLKSRYTGSLYGFTGLSKIGNTGYSTSFGFLVWSG